MLGMVKEPLEPPDWFFTPEVRLLRGPACANRSGTLIRSGSIDLSPLRDAARRCFLAANANRKVAFLPSAVFLYEGPQNRAGQILPPPPSEASHH